MWLPFCPDGIPHLNASHSAKHTEAVGPVCMECTMRGFRNLSGNGHTLRTIENNKFIQRPVTRSEKRGRCCFPPAIRVGNLPSGTDDLLGEHARADTA
jgi:hypothetical protein